MSAKYQDPGTLLSHNELKNMNFRSKNINTRKKNLRKSSHVTSCGVDYDSMIELQEQSLRKEVNESLIKEQN